MIRLYAIGGLLAALVVAGATIQTMRLRNARAALEAAQATAEAQRDVAAIQHGQMIAAQTKAAEYRQLYEDVRNVPDDETCRSPAIDRAFDLLRQRSGARSN